MRRLAILLACLPLLLPATPRADEVGDALGEATRAYQSGDLATTRSSLQEALQFLAQRSAAALAAALPGPLAGWKADDAETSAAALGLLGGGNQATRRYENADGKAVELQVTAGFTDGHPAGHGDEQHRDDGGDGQAGPHRQPACGADHRQ